MAQAHLAATYGAGTDLFDHFTYVMAGDGDMMEGISGEAASLAGHLQLGKLICLYDDNHVSLAAPTAVTFTEDVGARFAAYGWHVQRIDADHANDVAAIDAAIAAAKAESGKPSIVLIRTTIGFWFTGEPGRSPAPRRAASAPTTSPRRRRRWGGRSSRRSTSRTTRWRSSPSRSLQAAKAHAAWVRRSQGGKGRQRCASRRASSARCAGKLPDPAVADVQRRERQRCNA